MSDTESGSDARDASHTSGSNVSSSASKAGCSSADGSPAHTDNESNDSETRDETESMENSPSGSCSAYSAVSIQNSQDRERQSSENRETECEDDDQASRSSASDKHSESSSSSSSSSSSDSSPTGQGQVQQNAGFVAETTQQHCNRHNYPTFVKSCDRCRFVKNRTKWQNLAVFEHPQSGDKMTFLMETPDPLKNPWGLGGSLCRAAGFQNQYGLCRGKARLGNILRHGNLLTKQLSGAVPITSDHQKALSVLPG